MCVHRLAEQEQADEDELPTRNGALLRTADSLGVTRMRLEKQRQQTLLNEIATMDGMEDVILENIRQSATLILKVGLLPLDQCVHLILKVGLLLLSVC